MELPRRENRHEEWVDVDFSGQSFDWFGAYGGAFVRCRFAETSFERFGVGRGTQTRFVDCVFRRTRFPLFNTSFHDARFERCVFDHARLRDLRLDAAEFIDCTFRGRVWHTIFFGVPTGLFKPDRPRNEWRGNDFSEADLVDVDFRDIDLRAQRWPTDRDDYALINRVDERVEAATAAIHAQPGQAWPDRTWPDRAVRAVEFLRTHGHRDPHGFTLVRRRELGYRLPPQLRDQLWSLLVENYTDDQT
ncbi:pentapeptide repeat-containing protein [Dactylosporangium sp. NPDC005572]|uniref:pentapeptide repeat-containing protein n=1 Tax=Dactylosporangium sp. NPDC005572 TaxID=3156889 RepID=UPI0033B65231